MQFEVLKDGFKAQFEKALEAIDQLDIESQEREDRINHLEERSDSNGEATASLAIQIQELQARIKKLEDGVRSHVSTGTHGHQFADSLFQE